MRPPVLLALATTSLACTVPNPAFNPDTRADDTTLQTTVGPTTSAPATTSDEPTSDPATSESTAPITSTGAVDPATSTTDNTTDITTDITTGGVLDCWAQGPDGWPIGGAELKFLDTEPADPFISPDGLRLYYVALSERRPFLSTRASRDLPFGDGDPLAVWNGNDPKYAAAYPAVVLGGAEMLMSNNNDVAYSVHTPDGTEKYSKPAAIAGPNTAFPEQHVTATADGELLIVARVDGPPLPPFFKENSPRFHQFTRTAPKPGDPFTGDDIVTPKAGPLPFAICPVLSPDGLHLFFASTEALILDESNADELVGIYFTSRPARDAAWGPVSKLAIANNGVTCPSSVTDDGCELAYHQFHLNAGDYRMFLAARSP